MRTTTERGGQLIDDGMVAWLGEDDKGEPCNKINKREAKKFRSKVVALAWARASGRKRWWLSFKPESLTVDRMIKNCHRVGMLRLMHICGNYL
jgi:hypothetical protein